jgi:hypothetical protein
MGLHTGLILSKSLGEEAKLEPIFQNQVKMMKKLKIEPFGTMQVI